MRFTSDMLANMGGATSLSCIRPYKCVLNQCMNVLRVSLLCPFAVTQSQRHHEHHGDHHFCAKCQNTIYTVILAYIYVYIGQYDIHIRHADQYGRGNFIIMYTII